MERKREIMAERQFMTTIVVNSFNGEKLYEVKNLCIDFVSGFMDCLYACKCERNVRTGWQNHNSEHK